MSEVEEDGAQVVSDGVEDQQAQVDDGKVAPVAAEAVEVEPKLTLQVAGPCNNPNGLYVGLNKVQRDRLGVEVGGEVELRKEGKVVGIYTVGTGSKGLISRPECFTANMVAVGDTVEVVKARKSSDRLNSLPLVFGVETGDKHSRRSAIIAERFKKDGFDGQAYVVLPTATAKMLTGQTADKATVASIALGKVKIGGQEKTLPIVPAGTEFGMTSGAAKVLGIPIAGPTILENVEFYIENDGVLVINQLS